MTAAAMMAKAREIAADAMQDGLNEEGVKRRLMLAFPGWDGDYAAHEEIRSYGLEIYRGMKK